VKGSNSAIIIGKKGISYSTTKGNTCLRIKGRDGGVGDQRLVENEKDDLHKTKEKQKNKR